MCASAREGNFSPFFMDTFSSRSGNCRATATTTLPRAIRYVFRFWLCETENLIAESGIRRPKVICSISAVLCLLWQSPVWAIDIGPLLSTCPQHDPVYSRIRSDFEIRRNGVLVQDIPCSEPISQLPISQYTDELIVVQGLRAVFYMDLGSTSLPWAPGMTLYDWMKSKMAGSRQNVWRDKRRPPTVASVIINAEDSFVV
jgi:hypothetical protein